MTETDRLAAALLAACRRRGLKAATAESCTGGLVAAAITSLAGSSEIFSRGYVTYGNADKSELLGVPEALIATSGAVSEAVARRMAEGAKAAARADLAVGVTGIAGPGGGTDEKPVGTVWFGLATPDGRSTARRKQFPGDRFAVRAAATDYALSLLLHGAEAAPP